jgi:hypothetical protein
LFDDVAPRNHCYAFRPIQKGGLLGSDRASDPISTSDSLTDTKRQDTQRRCQRVVEWERVESVERRVSLRDGPKKPKKKGGSWKYKAFTTGWLLDFSGPVIGRNCETGFWIL